MKRLLIVLLIGVVVAAVVAVVRWQTAVDDEPGSEIAIDTEVPAENDIIA